LQVIIAFVDPVLSTFRSFFFFLFFLLGFCCAVCPSSGLVVVSICPLGVVLSGPAAVSPVCFIYKVRRKPISRYSLGLRLGKKILTSGVHVLGRVVCNPRLELNYPGSGLRPGLPTFRVQISEI